MDHTVLPANNTMPAFPSWAFTRWHHHNNWGSRHPIAAYYSFIDPKRMKGWVGVVGWPIADGLPTSDQPSATGRALDSESRPETNVLPLDHATSWCIADVNKTRGQYHPNLFPNSICCVSETFHIWLPTILTHTIRLC